MILLGIIYNKDKESAPNVAEARRLALGTVDQILQAPKDPNLSIKGQLSMHPWYHRLSSTLKFPYELKKKNL